MRQARRRTQAQHVSIPAPVRGLVENSQMDPTGAEYLENFLPTERGVKVRGGTVNFAFVASPVKAMGSYEAGILSKLFAASQENIFDVSVSAASATSPSENAMIWGQSNWGSQNWAKTESAVVSGLSSGDWSFQQIGTSGGEFLVGVNGADKAIIYDGADWSPLTDEAVNVLSFDAMSTGFQVGETITGGTSGATAEILGFAQTTQSTGKLFLGAITGTFEDDEALSSDSGLAVANGTASALSALTVTGVDTADLSHVWLYGGRLFFVEKNSLTAWYLPIAAVGGAANDLSLAGVFQRGGRLLLGGTWSLDSGDGLDDKCVFVSDQGEVAIYSGTNPSDAATWRLEGRYDIGMPLGKRATIRAGGDLLVATDDGVVPISAAIQRDRAALSLSAITNPIRNLWHDEARSAAGNVELLKWTAGNLMFAVFPESDRMLTVNLQTGAWAVQSGWSGNCSAIFNGDVFVGRSNGTVVKLNEGGRDLGFAFTARLAWPFLDMGDSTSLKVASMMRGSYFADTEFAAKYSISTDYTIDFPAPFDAVGAETDGLTWGSGNWGQKQWLRQVSAPRAGRVDYWVSVSGSGHSLAPQVQITSGSIAAMSVELLNLDLLVESGGRAA